MQTQEPVDSALCSVIEPSFIHQLFHRIGEYSENQICEMFLWLFNYWSVPLLPMRETQASERQLGPITPGVPMPCWVMAQRASWAALVTQAACHRRVWPPARGARTT